MTPLLPSSRALVAISGIPFGDRREAPRLSSALPPELRRLLTARGSELDRELANLETERDPGMYYEGLLQIGIRLKAAGEVERALPLLDYLAQAGLAEQGGAIRERAARERDAILGRGATGPRAEFLFSRVIHGAADYRAILPMLGATVLGHCVAAGLGARLLGTSELAWYSRGFAARGLVAAAAYGTEVSAFSLASRVLHPQDTVSWRDHFLGVALDLAALKGMGALARRWGGTAPRLAAPAAMVTGLLAARGLRHRLGLGPGFSDTTWFADSLADALSMGVGMHWGSRLLGPGLVAMQENLSSSLMRTPPGLASRPGSSEPNWAYAAASASSPVRGAPALASILSEPGSVAPPASGVVGESSGGSMGEARWSRQIVASGGARHPFQLLTNPEAVRLWQPEGASLVGERIPIAEREGGTIAIRIQRHEVNREADPITPEGVTKLNFTVEEGETRGKVFAYFDREAVTLYFIDLEESMITGGPAMRRGAGSIVLTWLAEQAAAQGKVFQVTRITSDQTVKILRRQGLIDPSACVEACTRLRPESYDEEYRVDATFPFGDEAAWRLHARNAEFFNVLAKRNPAR